MDPKQSLAKPFSGFTEAIQPTGTVNRFPAIAPSAANLPESARKHTFKDVTLHALTEKLKLNPLNARDNLKVAELVALRSASMSAVLESSLGEGVYSDQVLEDYVLLSNGMTHDLIVSELDKQRELSRKWSSPARIWGADKRGLHATRYVQ